MSTPGPRASISGLGVEKTPAAARGTQALQRTLARAARVEGVGLFSAARVGVTLLPAEPGHGVAFRRTDVPDAAPIPASTDHVEPRPRRTALKGPGGAVETVEHLLSALAGMGVDNALIEVHGPELPIGDGSALLWTRAIDDAGIVEQPAPRRVIAPAQPMTVQEGAASIAYVPPPAGDTSGVLELTYVLDYGEQPEQIGGPSPIHRQAFTCVVDPARYVRDVAPARTFSTLAEAQAAHAAGMFRHLSTSDLLVIGARGPIDNAYRFPDEPARHKVLDLLGDLTLAGGPIAGRVIAVRSGHALNQAMARALRAAAAASVPTTTPSPSPTMPPECATPIQTVNPHVPALDVRQIIATLPHRYPMLMVDRVTFLDSGKRAVGLKNVSINEPFFVGHYPAAPVMPGVLICEAMAQLAGLMLKDVLAHQGKVALLLAMDEVRWRRPVVPGDQLILEAAANKANARMADVSCKASVDGHVAAEARMKFMVVDPAQVGAMSGGASAGANTAASAGASPGAGESAGGGHQNA